MDEHGVAQNNFDEKDRFGVAHFKNLFRAPPHTTIAEVIVVAQMFPRIVAEEDNLSLIEVFSEEEIKVALYNFQKDKSLGSPNGWLLNFFWVYLILLVGTC